MIADLDRQRRITENIRRIAELCQQDATLADRTAQYLAGELPEPDETMKNLTVRLPAPLIERVERLLTREQFVLRYGAVKRADVIRECLVRGLAEIERETHDDS